MVSPRVHPAVAEQVDQLTGMTLAGNDQHLADPGELQQLERVVDHRPSPHREQVLVGDAGQLLETGGLSTGRDEPTDTRHGGRLYEPGRIGVGQPSRPSAA